MNKFMKTIAYAIPVMALFAIAIFAMPAPAHAWDWTDGSGDGWFGDTCFDCNSNFGDGWFGDVGSNGFCDGCNSWNTTSDFCGDCNDTSYSAPYNSGFSNWAQSTSWAQNTTEIINTNRNVNNIDIDLSGLRNQIVQNNTPTLTGSCYPSPSVVRKGENVTWYVNVNGGNGNYSYSWSGTDGLFGTGSSVYRSYSTTGSKTASVLVTSGNKSITVNCGTAVVENNNHNNDDFSVTCKASPSRVDRDERVRWIATVRGVDENDVDFRWSGDASGNDQEVTERYNDSGTYRATVRARYNGRTETDTCTVRVDGNNNGNGNVTLYSNPTPTGNLASLNSVYLSQVPYTGVEDNWKLAGIATLLALLSAWIAYEIVARKIKSDRKNAIANFKAENLANKA